MNQVVNTEQLAAWDGDEGEHWSTHEERYDATVHVYAQRLHDVAAIDVDEQVLDLGCGCGATTRDAARAAHDGAALGIDLSSPMLDRARSRAADAGLGNVSFVHGDAQVHPFPPATFDVVVSRFGAMFFADPVAAFANVAGAMRPDGRLALVAWQALARNEWLTEMRGALARGRDLPTPLAGAAGPFGFAEPDHVSSVLADAGFDDVEVDDVEAPFWMGADADDAFEFARGVGIARGLLAGLTPPEQDAALADLYATIESHAGAEGVVFGSRGWMITAVR